MAKKVTVNDIAKSLGVSRATVSRALNGADGVGEELRNQITEYANSVGYQVKSVDRPKKERRKNDSKIIGLVYGDIRNPFYAELASYIQGELSKQGYTVILFNSEYYAERELKFIEHAEKYQLAGLLLVTAQTNLAWLKENQGDVPVVFVNRTLELESFDSVTLDNFEAGYQAAMHLINLGHSRIGFVTGPKESSASMRRLEGYRQAMSNYFLTARPEDVVEGDLKMDTGYQLAAGMMEQEDHPTGIIFGNDLMAIGFMDWCEEHGVSVPDDVSVIGFDNIDYSRLRGVALTTVSQHVKEMGETAANLIVQRIENPDAEVRRVILKPTLIERKTTQEKR